uniref:Phosphoglycerate mutase-like protein n=1 Tax=Calcidiscus leptoporus TaxID=127549 RepID=A0A7S0P4D5_9EUKA|mmetsp:Transcript_57612/g.132299  ORF Transcript_57612/g.132299 Transcript_57612/m.132299 type:complete len:221 (+) Transcript_57612:81-743(+)
MTAANSNAEMTAPGKLLCLIRHGQGKHNPRPSLGFLPGVLRCDAPLTHKGRKQARAISEGMSTLPFELVVVSPLSRTIETATEVFGSGNEPPRVLCALMCERCIAPADQGTALSELRSKHPHIEAWSGMAHMAERFWPKRSSRLSSAEHDMQERIELFKHWLLARPEACIALVGHSAFFRSMTQQPKLGNCKALWCELQSDGTVRVCSPLPPPPGATTPD